MIEITESTSDVVVVNNGTRPNYIYKNKNPIEQGPENFTYEKTTMWDFPDRGNWYTHTSQYRGNWSPKIVRNLLHLYSKKGDYVLDPMVGGGTTPVECKLMKRNSISVDINPAAINITRRQLDYECNKETTHKTYVGDARNLDFIDNETIDVILTHPPYANIIRYSEDIEGDLSRITNYDSFFKEYQKVIKESFRVLKPGSYCAIMIGDTHNRGHYVPLSTRILLDYLKNGFIIKEEIIKKEHNCFSSINAPNYKSILLTAHEHLYVMRKPLNSDDSRPNSSYDFFNLNHN